MDYTILTINPGSTSTKIALFRNEELIWNVTIRHTSAEIGRFHSIPDQFEWRLGLVLEALEDKGVDIRLLSVVIGRGGLVKPIEGGIYHIDDAMLRDLRETHNQHASNLGAPIALAIAEKAGIKAYIADPPTIDELQLTARISGIKELPRISIFHALNQKAVARLYAHTNGRRYKDLNLIVVHMGGGISVGAHRKGRVVDVNNAFNGEGPLAPERAGTLPAGQLVDLCFSGRYTQAELKKLCCGRGGIMDWLGTNSIIEVEKRAKAGDEEARLMLETMCYTISKTIGSMAAVLCGDIDAIILTGGLANNEDIVERIMEHCSFLAPIAVYPGEDEMQALAESGLMLLRGEAEAKSYGMIYA